MAGSRAKERMVFVQLLTSCKDTILDGIMSQKNWPEIMGIWSDALIRSTGNGGIIPVYGDADTPLEELAMYYQVTPERMAHIIRFLSNRDEIEQLEDGNYRMKHVAEYTSSIQRGSVQRQAAREKNKADADVLSIPAFDLTGFEAGADCEGL